MKKSILATSVILAAVILPLEAKAVNFSNLYVFGDSLSDIGNVFTASGNTVPLSPPYFQGHFSNGKIWVEYLAKSLGLPLTNSLAGGTNSAYGGATTGKKNIGSPLLPSLQQEIDDFTFANPNSDPNALYIIWAGANDYLGGGITDPTIPVSNLSTAITNLKKVGAKEFLVVNLPDLGTLPGTSGNSGLNALTSLHNSGLANTLNNLRSSLGVEIFSLDVNSIFKDVISNPSAYNFTNVTDACLLTGCINPENYLFWDDIHPTTAGHKFIGQLAFQTVTAPEPSTIFSLLTFGILGTGVSWKRQQQKAKSNQDKAA